MANIVLVHGGWQGGWCWDAVAEDLQAAGHSVLAPTLRGSEPESEIAIADATSVDRDVDLQTVGDNLIAHIDAAGWDDLVLVGHSGGGPTIQHAADRLLPRVRRLVFVDAWVLRDGEATLDVQPSADTFRAIAASRPDGTIPLDENRWREEFMNSASVEVLAATTSRLIALPLRQLAQPIRLPRLHLNARPGTTPDTMPPTSYVFLRHDRTVDPDLWHRMADRLYKPRLLECDGPHEAMLTHPHQLAEALQLAL